MGNKMNTLEKSPFRNVGKLVEWPSSFMCYQGVSLTKVVGHALHYKQNAGSGAKHLQGACSGDTGSPLACMVLNENSFDTSQFIQTGVTGMGLTCGAEKVPGLYTRVSGIANWLYKTGRKYGKVQFRKAPDTSFKPRGRK